MKKDDLVTLTIEDIGHDGEGIGKVMGMTLFVKDALPGDVIQAKIMKMKKTYGYARLMEILSPSLNRVEPRCEHHKRCGGCQLQALSYESQLKFKEEKVRNNLIRIGGFTNPPVRPTLGMKEPYRYRNKAQYPIGVDREGKPVAGFYAARTHSIIPVEDCVLGKQGNGEILRIVLQIMEEKHISAYNEQTGKGCIRHVLIRYGEHTGEWMVCLVINEKKLPCGEIFAQRLSQIPGMTSITVNVNREKTNVILGSHTETIWGQGYITDFIGDISFQISPQSFYQVNPGQTRVLYEKALEYAGLTGNETVWDLYCGIGTISLFLAQKAKKVYGVEIVPQAIENARDNAKRNHIGNAEFFVGKAEEVYPAYCREHGEDARAEVIVVDPPRKGCEESLLEMMCQMSPKRIVYVSCDSATLARDLKYLAAHGYELVEVQPVDQFGQTVHVESVILMQYCGKEKK
ncbi:MAG: 23S rRNA (uracil(1939)-C(5))-methyltransferase RlmD [Lachnospiraceae bacterium]|nr:23S rRNA (uracil(1939)-C(5))-methyltransferase RlmD [Lachnospiraceae bacterium]